ncbi:SMI1/KNR4 family protein [Mesonia sp. K4-1]|uniref:SMI1/KNR4 family protein n=1 Tax=Mesonia sp. K4-1 TaxID=2602760 RepID=UPI0011C9FF74|nr:SMI1/KNR4 family protein [Mesonia sp. K4-1]TXK74406.1 SMI1/KNR4 family protein [Mesonia sp. K4-1]
MFEQTEPKLENQDLIDFENKFDIVLSQNYKELMLKYNGGYTEANESFDTLKSIKYGELKVETSILIHQNTERNIPKNFLPIANDFSDNIICLNLEENENYGKIYCFYFDVDKVDLLSNSLEELLGVNSIEEL